jgi:predicted nucleic acid-binding protein
LKVFVETNFVLELAFRQEQWRSCAELLDQARRRQIELVVPAYCLTEPYETIGRRRKERTAFQQQLKPIAEQLARTEGYVPARELAASIAQMLVDANEQDVSLFQETVEHLLDVAHVIALQGTTIEFAVRLERALGIESKPDALVLASVLENLASRHDEESLFLNKNRKDFQNPSVQDELQKYGCRLLFQFADGVGYLAHSLARNSRATRAE